MKNCTVRIHFQTQETRYRDISITSNLTLLDSISIAQIPYGLLKR